MEQARDGAADELIKQTKDGGIRFRECISGKARQTFHHNGADIRGDQRGQERKQQAVERTGNNSTSSAASGVCEDSGSAARKEAGQTTGNDHRQTKQGPDEHANEAADGGEDKAKYNRIGRIGINNRAVQCRDGAGHHLFGNAGEGRNQLGNQERNTAEQDVNTHTESDSLNDGKHDIVHASGGFSHDIATGQDGNDNIQGDHNCADGKVCIRQEGQLGANLDILGGVFRIANQLADKTRENAAQGGGVGVGNFIAAGDLAHDGLCCGRKQNGKGSANQHAHDDGRRRAHAEYAFPEEDAYHGKVKRCFAVEEDVLKWCDAGQDDVHNIDPGICQSDVTGQSARAHGNGIHGFHGCHHAIGTHSGGEPSVEMLQAANDNAAACA